MSIVRVKVATAALGAAAIAFTFGCVGCAHAKTTQATENATANQTSDRAANQNSNQASGQNSAQDSDQNAAPGTQQQEMMKFSHNGHDAIDDIQAARVAIFQGHPHVAIQLMDKAQTSVDAAEREAPDFKMATDNARATTTGRSKMADQNVTFVPVDGSMSLGEDYVATPEKQRHIDAANEHLKNGETKQALDELKLAGVDVRYTMVFMPIASSRADLQKAISLANAGKYYEANLALRSIDKRLVVVSDSMVDVPKNGAHKNARQGANNTSKSGSTGNGPTARQ